MGYRVFCQLVRACEGIKGTSCRFAGRASLGARSGAWQGQATDEQQRMARPAKRLPGTASSKITGIDTEPWSIRCRGDAPSGLTDPNRARTVRCRRWPRRATIRERPRRPTGRPGSRSGASSIAPWLHHDRTRPDLPVGCPERFGWLSLEFWAFIWPTRHPAHTKVLPIHDRPPAHLHTVRLGDRRAVERLLSDVEGR